MLPVPLALAMPASNLCCFLPLAQLLRELRGSRLELLFGCWGVCYAGVAGSYAAEAAGCCCSLTFFAALQSLLPLPQRTLRVETWTTYYVSRAISCY
jgi:hypothetical protein